MQQEDQSVAEMTTTPSREIIKSFFAMPTTDEDAGSDVFAGCLVRARSAAAASPDESMRPLHTAGTNGMPVTRAFALLGALVLSMPEERRLGTVWDIAHAAALCAERVASSDPSSVVPSAATKCSRLVSVTLRQFVPLSLKCDACAKHWNGSLSREFPVPASEAFAKTVEIRNGVNRILGKPEIPLDEARALCAWAGPHR